MAITEKDFAALQSGANALTQQRHDAAQSEKDRALKQLLQGQQQEGTLSNQKAMLAEQMGMAQNLKKQYGPEAAVNVEGVSIGARDPLQTLLRQQQLSKPVLTPGQEAADKAFGKDYSDSVALGGNEALDKNIQQLEFAKSGLKDTDMVDRIAGVLPKAARDIITPKAAAREDAVRNAIQSTLRQTLGAQFTEKEGTAIMERAYNPRQSPEENMRRLNVEIEAIKRQADQKKRSSAHFERTGSLVGLPPAQPGMGGGKTPPASLQDLIGVPKAAAPSMGGQRTPAKKLYSPSRNQTKIVYSDGTEEVVDGQQ